MVRPSEHIHLGADTKRDFNISQRCFVSTTFALWGARMIFRYVIKKYSVTSFISIPRNRDPWERGILVFYFDIDSLARCGL